LALLTIAAGVATVLGAWFAHRAVVVARVTTIAAERAYLEITDFTIGHPINEQHQHPHEIHFAIKNVGGTPAKIVETTFYWASSRRFPTSRNYDRRTDPRRSRSFSLSQAASRRG
jgi:hypothetical protein